MNGSSDPTDSGSNWNLVLLVFVKGGKPLKVNETLLFACLASFLLCALLFSLDICAYGRNFICFFSLLQIISAIFCALFSSLNQQKYDRNVKQVLNKFSKKANTKRGDITCCSKIAKFSCRENLVK